MYNIETIKNTLTEQEQLQLLFDLINNEKQNLINKINELEEINKKLQHENLQADRYIHQSNSNDELTKEQCKQRNKQIHNNIYNIIENQKIIRKFNTILELYKRD